jgi:sulfur-carrier protein
VARLRLFGPAREAAGVTSINISGERVSGIIAAAELRFGTEFSRVLAVSNIWLNGDVTSLDAPVGDEDEIAVIPPVSGG